MDSLGSCGYDNYVDSAAARRPFKLVQAKFP